MSMTALRSVRGSGRELNMFNSLLKLHPHLEQVQVR
jgi:hypothetical protein